MFRSLLVFTFGLGLAWGVMQASEGWSPDGQQVAYSAYDGTIWDVWVMRSDGAYPARLTSGARNNSRPSWSPDASKIVFVSDRDGTKDVWLMNRDGSGQRKVVTSPGPYKDWEPAWGAPIIAEPPREAQAKPLRVERDAALDVVHVDADPDVHGRKLQVEDRGN